MELDHISVSELSKDYFSRVAKDIEFDDRKTSASVVKHNSHPSVDIIWQTYDSEGTFRFNQGPDSI